MPAEIPSISRIIQAKGLRLIEMATESDPLFAPPHYWLARHAKTESDRLAHCARALLLEDPDTELGQRTITLVAETVLGK